MKQWLSSAAAAILAMSPMAHAATVDVYVYNLEFSINPPGEPIVDAVITVGDTVRWVHVQGNHTTTSVAGSIEVWNSPISASNPQFSHTFTNVGTFWYYCIPHGVDLGDGTATGMSGTVTVLPAVTGACCLGAGMCSVLSPAECTNQGGTYLGDGTTCAGDPCITDPTGACCFDNGSCAEATDMDCGMAGGNYQGNNTLCGTVECAVVLEPFVDELPRPGVATPTSGMPGGSAHYDIEMTEQFQQLHRDLPPTRCWGYAGSYPGPTIEARTGEPVTVTWINDLRVFETGVLRTTHALPVDTCLHGPDVTGDAPVAIVHLHGGKVAPASDGYPEFAFPPGEQSPIYTYPNDQPAATIWYHDHALGITRLNVMMGMAGFYIIRDDAEDALDLPDGEYEIPLAIQDRSFNADGSWKYPAMWHEHFFGDTIVVNGKVWPYLNVDRGKYRFRMVNGSGSRTYTLSLSDGATFWQIGTDLGLLEAPVALTEVTIQPGERADVIVDFASYAPGTEIIFTNSAPAPFPGFPGVGVIPEIMKFIVQNVAGDTDPLPGALVDVPALDPQDAVMERVLELMRMPNECVDHHDLLWTIDGLMWHEITEMPVLDTTEIWTWKNDSGIGHPMHLHLVAQQVLDRQAIDPVTGEPTGPILLPAPNEAGWKDTVQAPPGYFTRVIMRFEGFTGPYPYHCHILEHEDHEMMRQFEVVPPVLLGDLNDDGFVDELDRAALCSALGSSIGDPEYLAAADFDENGMIDHFDQAMFNAILPPCVGDVATSATFAPPADGVVNAADLANLLGDWGLQPSCADSVTSGTFAPPPDGVVDAADLANLLGNWGVCD